MDVIMTLKLVSNVDEVLKNVTSFYSDLGRYADLMPYARSWYAVRTRGGWSVAPSKFIGYVGMTPEIYLGSPYDSRKHGRASGDAVMDGRVTEGVLGRWSNLVEPGHPLYNELHTALNELCARFGKKPNSLARISVIDQGGPKEEAAFDDDLVQLLAKVFGGLSPAQRALFRKLTA